MPIRSALVASLLAATLVAFAPPAQAQDAQGILYFATGAGPDLAGGLSAGPANSCPVTNSYTMTMEAPADGKAYASGSTEAFACSTFFTYTAESAFTFSGAATVQFYVSCDVPGLQSTPATLAYRIVLHHNGEAVVPANDGDTPSGAPCTGPTTILEYSYALDPTGLAFAVGDTMTVEILLWNTDPAGNNMHFLVGPTHPSSIRGPGLPSPGGANVPIEGAKTVYQNTTAGAVAIAHTFTTATSDTYVYNWTTSATSVAVSYNATVTNGTAAYTIKDSSGKTLASGTLNKNAASTTPQTVSGKAGVYQVSVKYTSFQGVLKLDVAPHTTTSSSGTTTGSGGTSAGNTDDDGTDSSTQTFGVVDGTQQTQDSPSVPLHLLLAALAAMVLVSRRRLA